MSELLDKMRNKNFSDRSDIERLIVEFWEDCDGGLEHFAERAVTEYTEKDRLIDTQSAEITELREWKLAVDDACVINWVNMTTPKETVNNLIAWNVKMALDPAISEQPAKWVARIAELEAMIEAIRLETQSVCPVPYGGAVYRIIEIIGEAQ